MRAASLGQNFLRNPRVARRVAELAGGPDDALVVDLGAGRGMITEACLRRNGPVLAVEVDDRLILQLRSRFRNDQRVDVVASDLLTVPLPEVPYVIAANPPFNLSTMVVRRWMTADRFHSAAVIAEGPFARKLAGLYGATKLSLAMSPFFGIAVPEILAPTDFRPRPAVQSAILTVTRKREPDLDWAQRREYWLFINYLFERSRLTVAESLKPLRLSAVSRELRARPVRELNAADAATLFRCADGSQDALIAFDRGLPAHRRLNLGPTAQHSVHPQHDARNDPTQHEPARSQRPRPSRRTPRTGRVRHSGRKSDE